MLSINVFEIVGGPYAVSSSDGELVYGRINTTLKNDENVNLSLRNIKVLTPAFLNTAIGQLYGQFNEQYIDSRLEILYLGEDDKELLKLVVETAKQYFQDPDRFNQIISEDRI